jgi:hypothetical protein
MKVDRFHFAIRVCRFPTTREHVTTFGEETLDALFRCE